MSTKFLSPGWRMPRNANQNKQANYSLHQPDQADFIESSYSINGLTQITVSCWIKTTTNNNDEHVWSFPKTGTGSGFALQTGNNNNGLGFKCDNYAMPSVVTVQDTTFNYADGNWHNVIISSSDTKFNMYINGVLKASTSITGAAMSGTIDKFFIGSFTNSYPQYNVLNMSFSDVCIFDYALSDGGVSVGSTAAGQIADLWGGGTSVSNPMALPNPPQAYYPLGESAGGFVGGTGTWLTENNAIGDYVFDFSGASDRVYGPTGVFSDQTATTISFWVNPDALTGVQNLFANGGYPYFRLNNANIETTWPVSGNNFKNFASGMTAGKWHLFVFKWQSGSKYQVYVDDELKGESTSTITGSFSSSNTGNLEIGNAPSNQDLQGKISNFKTWDVALTTSELTTLYNYGSPIRTLASIPQNSNLKAWYKLDASEVYNSTTTEWSIDNNQNPSAYPSSLEFDSASSDYISCGNDSSLNTNALTVSCWVKCDPFTPAVGPAIISKDIQSTNSPERSFGFLFVFGSFLFQNWDSAGNENRVTISNATIPINTDGQWHHLVATIDGTTNANGIKVYIDNVVVGQATATATGIRTSTVPFVIGGSGSTGTDYNWNGQISNVSYWNAGLTSAQVTELYNNGTPSNLSSHSVTSNLVSWWKLNNTTTGIEDSKGSNNGTNNGATEYAGFVNKLVGDSSGMSQANLVQSDLQTVAPYSRYAMSFDGSDDYIGVTTSSITGNSARSMSFWYKTTSSSAMIPFSIGNPSSFGIANSQFAYCINNGSTTQAAVFAIATNDVTPITGVPATNDGDWHHVVVSWSGSVLSLHIDGASYSTPQPAGNYNTTAGFKMGGWGNNDRKFNGQLSNCSVWNTALTSAQITELYNQGLPSNLNNHSAYSNLVSWWQLGENSSFDGNDWIVADEMPAGNNGTSTGMPVGALVNGVGTTANGVSSGMSEGSLVGDAPYSTANALSTNMAVTARVTGSGNTP